MEKKIFLKIKKTMIFGDFFQPLSHFSDPPQNSHLLQLITDQKQAFIG